MEAIGHLFPPKTSQQSLVLQTVMTKGHVIMVSGHVGLIIVLAGTRENHGIRYS